MMMKIQKINKFKNHIEKLWSDIITVSENDLP